MIKHWGDPECTERGTNCHDLQGRKYATELLYVKSCLGAEGACVVCGGLKAGPRGGYKGAVGIHTQKGALASLEPVSNGGGCREENEPANSSEEPRTGGTGLAALDWVTSAALTLGP